MPITPIRLNQWPVICSGRSDSPSDVSPMKPRGSTCLPNGSSIGLPSASTFLDRSGVGDGRCRALGADGDRDQAPDDHDDAHDGGRPHDLQRLVARFVDALDVDPPEVDRHHDRDRRREPVLVGHQRAVGAQLEQVVEQADDVLAGRDAADRAGQDVVEQQRRDRQPGQPAAHRLLDDAVHAAAHEHGAALDVDAAHARS